MKPVKKALLSVLSLILALALAGCELVSVNSERDLAQVIAQIDDAVITKRRVNYVFENMASYYGYNPNTTDVLEQLQVRMQRTQVVGDMVDEQIGRRKAAELGYEGKLTAEDLAAIEEEYNEFVEYYTVAYKDMLSESYKDQEDGLARAEREAQEMLEEYLLNNDMASLDAYKENLTLQKMRERLDEDIRAEAKLDDAEVKAAYETQLETHKETYDTASAYASAESGGLVMLYTPAGLRRVKNLLIQIPKEQQTEISSLRDEGKADEADALYQEALDAIRPAAEQALARAQDGEDFNALLDELGEDTGMAAESEGREKGYLVYEGNETYVEAFTQGAMAIAEEGGLSDLVATEFGYHIIQYFREMKEGVVPYEDIKEEFDAEQLKTKQSELIGERYNEWYTELEEAGKLKVYMDRVEPVKVFGQG